MSMVTAATERPTVLVVDDTPANLSLLSNLLKEQYRIKVANCGSKALELANAVPPDLVLLDIMMPEMDGYEVCRSLKANTATRHVPVIFLTAKTETDDEEMGFAVGAVDFIHKPISPPIVAARVKTHLEIKAWHDLMRDQNAGLMQYNGLIRSTFERYLSAEVVEGILSSPDGGSLGGENRLVTILMSDLRGFTSISERLPATDVLNIVNIYLERMTEVITKYNGTIIEFIGDAVFAVFGAPYLREDDAKRAVACAIEMQNAMGDVNLRCLELGYPEVEQGIGVHTGESVVGNIGSIMRTKYGLVGKNVNLTSRIESYTVGNQILISGSTAKACGPILSIRDTREVMPKGVQKPLTLWDIGGIGESFNISLLTKALPELVELKQYLQIGFFILEGKDTTLEKYVGVVRALSPKEGLIQSHILPESLSNLKLVLADEDEVASALYAKVTASPSGTSSSFKVNFTFMPPHILKYIEGILLENEIG